MIWTLLLACAPDYSALSGTVFSGLETGTSLPDAAVTAYDFGLMETDQVRSGTDGGFSTQVRSSALFYLELSADGHATTGLTGSIGGSDLAVEDGLIWLRTQDELDQVRADFAGCPGADGDGAVIEGEIRLFIPGQDAADAPISNSGWAVAWDRDGQSTEACYLLDDEAQTLYDEAATHTGFHGRFAIFDAPTGQVSVEVGYDIEDYTYYQTSYYLYVPAGGVAPMYPAWVEL